MTGLVAFVSILIFLGMIDQYNLLKEIRDELRKMNGEDEEEESEVKSEAKED